MDFEAPADAWYVFIGVALVSVAVAGVAMGFTGAPPPDANAAVNTIDKVAGDPHGGTASYEHDAEMYKTGGKQISLRNDGGTARATVSFGTVLLADAHPSLTAMLHGKHPREISAFDDPQEFEDVSRAHDQAFHNNGPKWRKTDGTLRVRKVTWGDHSVTIVDF